MHVAHSSLRHLLQHPGTKDPSGKWSAILSLGAPAHGVACDGCGLLLVANCGWSWLVVVAIFHMRSQFVLAITTLIVVILDDTVILASFR